RHTRWPRDWSSDVCSSDLVQKPTAATALRNIQNTYDFDPSKLSFEEQAKRAPTLSALWDRYDKTSDVYRDALRTALKTPDAREQIGRASCRERVKITVGAG